MGSKYITTSKWNTNYVDPARPFLGAKPTKHFQANFKESITPGKGLSKGEIKKLPKGITVIEATRERDLRTPRILTKQENHLRQVAIAKVVAKKKRIRAFSKAAARSQRN